MSTPSKTTNPKPKDKRIQSKLYSIKAKKDTFYCAELTGKPNLSKSMTTFKKDFDTDKLDNREAIVDRLYIVKKCPDPLTHLKELTPFKPQINTKKVPKKRCQTPATERLFVSKSAHEEKNVKMQQLFDEKMAELAPNRPNITIDTERFEKLKDYDFLKNNFRSLEEQNAYYESKKEMMMEEEIKYNTATPNTKMFESYKQKSQPLDSRKQWKYHYHHKNNKLVEIINTDEQKKGKQYEPYLKIMETVKKASYIKDIKKNGTQSLHDLRKEKISGLDLKYNGKEKEDFNMTFWPKFGKRLEARKVGDKTVYSLKDRPKSRENPTIVSDRMYSNYQNWTPYKNLDHTRGLKSQIDNYYPWTLQSVAKVVKNYESDTKKDICPMANTTQSLTQVNFD